MGEYVTTGTNATGLIDPVFSFAPSVDPAYSFQFSDGIGDSATPATRTRFCYSRKHRRNGHRPRAQGQPRQIAV
jgi:hypothetical protein